MRPLPFAVAAAVLTTAVHASDLDVTVQSGGSSTVIATSGGTVSYQIMGELADSDNQGLGLVLLDLSYSGGDLSPADTPLNGPMVNFTMPAGITNPAGYGGVVVGGDLQQVGGGQNTINNAFAPFPNGSVVTGVGGNGAPVTLASGQLTAPTAPGTTTLSVTKVTATAITSDATGTPFWEVEPAPAGALTNLDVVVETGCYDSLGFGGPGALDLSICGEDLTIRETEANVLLTGGTPNATAFIVLGLTANPIPVQGGTLVPDPLLILQLQTDGSGQIAFVLRGADGPANTIICQMVVDPGPGPGLDFSNAISVNIGS